MARVKLIQPEDCPDQAALVDRIRKGRRGTVINVYKTLLHTPDVASVWLDLVNVVRWKVDLDGRLREIVIVRIGYLNRCAYVVNQHVPELTAPEGLSKEECAALADWRASGVLQRTRARGARLCRRHDARDRRAGSRVRGAAQALQ